MRFYGQFDVPVDRFIFERYFPDIGIKGTFVECGAFDGLTECSCKFFEETMGWKGYNLEPVPWIFENLTQNRPSSRNLPYGLSNEAGTKRFTSVIHPTFGRDTTIGAIEHSSDLLKLLTSEGCTFEEISIEVRSWNDFVKGEGISEIDLLVLDVEGHELNVLSGMSDSNVRPFVICVEFGHAGFDKLYRALDALGYEYDIHSFANAYFVRRDKLPLFAHRRASKQQPIAPAKDDELQTKIGSLQERLRWFEQREAELVSALDTIKATKGWRALEFAKKFLPTKS